MILPDSPGESWKVEVCVTCSFDRRYVNSNIVIINDCDVRELDAPNSNPNYAGDAIEYPESGCYPNVQRVTFIILFEEIKDVIKSTTENHYADADMRCQENFVGTSAN